MISVYLILQAHEPLCYSLYSSPCNNMVLPTRPDPHQGQSAYELYVLGLYDF